MGMISEICAMNEAESLHEILTKAIDSQNPEIIKFCKENVLQFYLNAESEAFSTPDPKLLDLFK